LGLLPLETPANGQKVQVEMSDEAGDLTGGGKPCMRSRFRLLPNECKVGPEQNSSKQPLLLSSCARVRLVFDGGSWCSNAWSQGQPVSGLVRTAIPLVGPFVWEPFGSQTGSVERVVLHYV